MRNLCSTTLNPLTCHTKNIKDSVLWVTLVRENKQGLKYHFYWTVERFSFVQVIITQRAVELWELDS